MPVQGPERHRMQTAVPSLREVEPLPQPYLLFLGDVAEPAYAKTAFGLRDWVEASVAWASSHARARPLPPASR